MKHKTYEDGVLYNGDCLKVMPKLIQQGIKVDAIITDVPYGTTNAKWDIIIPFDKMWNNLNQLAKENTPIVLFGTEPFSSELRLSNKKQFRYDWYWEKDKGSNFLFGNKQPMKVIEVASVFYEHQPTYHSQKILNPNGVSKRYLYFDNSIMSNKAKSLMTNMPEKPKMGKNYEPDKLLAKQLVYFSREQRNKYHPTQKPVALMEYLIKTYTNEGDTVLDFTCGSGSTLVACRNLKRRFIGIEKDEHYYKICKHRLCKECRKSLF